MNRRHFIAATAGAITTTLRADSPPKAPFRVLYSNDTTNITSCISPWRKAGEPFRAKMLEASVDEVAGLVDAHFLQPGLGMVPMWPSKVIPLDEHYAWIKQRYGVGPDSFGKFVLGGGDVVKVFIDRCRQTKQAAFISFRLNDAHHKEFADPKPGDKPGTSIGMSVTRHYIDHPEFVLKPGSKRGSDLVQNWAFEEVRAQKLALITELCENYDLDGLELDFMRFYSFFDPAKTALEQRREIMTGFVKQVRQLLDRTARDGRRRWLCARVPCLVSGLDALGIDLPSMTAAGLDMVNISASYFTTQQMELSSLRQLSRGAAMYVEMCHSIANGTKLTPGYDTFPFRRATREEMQTTAHLAYRRGADGVSLFNFAYYREHGGAGRGPFAEPPFDILKSLGNKQLLSRQPQHWFIATGWNNPFVRPPTLPRELKAGQKAIFHFDLAPPASGWKNSARLRLQTEGATTERTFSARWNGVALQSTPDVSEPFANPYPSMLGKPEELHAWDIPVSQLRDGTNSVELSFAGGDAVTLTFLDIAAR